MSPSLPRVGETSWGAGVDPWTSRPHLSLTPPSPLAAWCRAAGSEMLWGGVRVSLGVLARGTQGLCVLPRPNSEGVASFRVASVPQAVGSEPGAVPQAGGIMELSPRGKKMPFCQPLFVWARNNLLFALLASAGRG